MNETWITVAGNVATEPKHVELEDGRRVTSFRLASTPTWQDRQSGDWKDGDTSYYSVSCWRALALNTAMSVRLGDPLVVTGRVKIRDWETEEKRGTTVDIDASAVGHDLSRGVSTFRRLTRAKPANGSQDDARRVPVQVADDEVAEVDRVTGELSGSGADNEYGDAEVAA